MFYKFAKFIAKWAIKILFGYKVVGKEKMPTDTGFIVCSNHKSAWDVIVSGSAYDNPVFFMAKQELFKKKFFAYFLNKLHAFPVSRGAADISAIKNSLKALKEGYVLNIYPEGTRVKDGELHEIKQGAALIATKAKVPIVPCAICGEYKLFGKISFKVGTPIYLDEYYGRKLTEIEFFKIMENVMSEIKGMI